MPVRKVFVRRRPRKFNRRNLRVSRHGNWDGKLYSFKRSVQTTVNIQDAAAPIYTAYSYALNSVPNATEFSYLFDQYKITGIKVKLIPSFNSFGMVPTTTAAAPWIPNIVPMCYTVIDYDDATALTAVADYMQYQNCRAERFDHPITRYFKPKCAIAAYSGAFTSYASSMNQWIDVNSSTVQHYGFKICIDTSQLFGDGSHHLGNYTVITTYYMKFKEVR